MARTNDWRKLLGMNKTPAEEFAEKVTTKLGNLGMHFILGQLAGLAHRANQDSDTTKLDGELLRLAVTRPDMFQAIGQALVVLGERTAAMGTLAADYRDRDASNAAPPQREETNLTGKAPWEGRY